MKQKLQSGRSNQCVIAPIFGTFLEFCGIIRSVKIEKDEKHKFDSAFYRCISKQKLDGSSGKFLFEI